MAGTGFGRGMGLIACRKDYALAQPLQPAREMRTILGEQIRRELIDRDGDDQLGRSLRLGMNCRWKQSGKRGNEGFADQRTNSNHAGRP